MIRVPITATEGGKGVVYYASLDYKPFRESGFRVEGVINLEEKQHDSLRRTKAIAESIVGPFERGILLSFDKTVESFNGRSWELMLALGMMSLKTGIPLRPEFAARATVDAVDKIGSVGSISEKIEAARKHAHSRFLVSTEQEEYRGMENVIPVSSVYSAFFILTGLVPVFQTVKQRGVFQS